MAPTDFLEQAIAAALENVRSGGGPFGAVIVQDGKVVATGVNRVTTTNDPTAHAEIVAIREACARLGTFDLSGCEIYSSCEPCPMCFGGIYWAHLEHIYFGASRFDAADAGFDDHFIYEELARPANERRVGAIAVKHQDSLKPFREWLRKNDRIAY